VDIPKVSVGRIVHFVLESPDHSGVHHHRPAIVVRAWNDDMVQLQVFTDASNDGAQGGGGVVWQTSVHYSETHEPRSWHWPERD